MNRRDESLQRILDVVKCVSDPAVLVKLHFPQLDESGFASMLGAAILNIY